MGMRALTSLRGAGKVRANRAVVNEQCIHLIRECSTSSYSSSLRVVTVTYLIIMYDCFPHGCLLLFVVQSSASRSLLCPVTELLLTIGGLKLHHTPAKALV